MSSISTPFQLAVAIFIRRNRISGVDAWWTMRSSFRIQPTLPVLFCVEPSGPGKDVHSHYSPAYYIQCERQGDDDVRSDEEMLIGLSDRVGGWYLKLHTLSLPLLLLQWSPLLVGWLLGLHVGKPSGTKFKEERLTGQASGVAGSKGPHDRTSRREKAP